MLCCLCAYGAPILCTADRGACIRYLRLANVHYDNTMAVFFTTYGNGTLFVDVFKFKFLVLYCFLCVDVMTFVRL